MRVYLVDQIDPMDFKIGHPFIIKKVVVEIIDEIDSTQTIIKRWIEKDFDFPCRDCLSGHLMNSEITVGRQWISVAMALVKRIALCRDPNRHYKNENLHDAPER